ncbi:endonuclease/exonuclease/phosphatase family protein [Micromonospora sp. WMMD1102]|uniref:endonuclease/exonuclease/phosphatase family protein n=1 Tax=Micromonospora sp. WMMD1102 TaxID=3016105 RepID=UPI0024155A55|nr:endonuclease/exonuclease/phosphatase family protein [Micromonospora sp. WMMD1102]MDG4785495.1 endonuclease/exonuclease/phosphatase family protein [Micromonospora sp. WMMD1102]
MTGLCWLSLLPVLGLLAARLAGLEYGPLVQLLAFTPYLLPGTLLPLGLALAARRWWTVSAAAVAALVLVVLVAPRALPDRQPAANGTPLRVLTANLLAGAGEPATLVALVRDERVDVLAAQEFTPEAEAALDRLGLAELLPHRQVNPEVGTTGSALYSRHPLRDAGIRRNGGGFSQAYATVQPPGGPAALVESVHPMAPAALDWLADWRADLRAQPPATMDGPLRILAGDFNATADHAPLRDLLDTGYADAADRVGAGLVGTWGPYDGDPIPPVTIDHVLVDRRIAVVRVAVLRLPGSDHRPVLAELTLPAS